MTERLLYPQNEVAHLLGVSLRKVGYLISGGELKSRVIGGRRLIHIDEVKRFAKADHPLPKEKR